jgi:hypothetical protein
MARFGSVSNLRTGRYGDGEQGAKMNWHLAWLWFWFTFGSLVYMTKRAYYLIKGPNPVANNVGQFVEVAWVPLGFRFIADSALYWLCFTPQLLAAFLSYIHCDDCASVVSVITQYGVCALLFGMAVDPMVDWGIGTVLSKVPFLGDFWPQMPPPLPKTNVAGAGK